MGELRKMMAPFSLSMAGIFFQVPFVKRKDGSAPQNREMTEKSADGCEFIHLRLQVQKEWGKRM